MLKEIEEIEKHIEIKHVFLDGGDEYEKAAEYIDRSFCRINESSKLFKQLKLYSSCGQLPISPWARCAITKILCDHIGSEHFEIGGLDTDK